MGAFLYKINPEGGPSQESAEVPHEQVKDYLSSGEWGLPPGKAKFVGDDGKTYVAPAENALKILEADSSLRLYGREDALQKNYGTAEGIARAAALGAARGLTFGLSDAMLSQSREAAQTVRNLQEANPTSSVLGEVGAILATTAVAPEAGAAKLGLLGKGARLAGTLPRAAGVFGRATADATEGLLLKTLGTEGVTTSLAKRALAKAVGHAAGGVAESVPYAAGHIVSEQALGDPRSVSEAVASDVLPMLIFGGVVGGTVGSAGDLAGSALQKVGAKLEAKMAAKTAGLPEELEQRVGWESARAFDATPAFEKKFRNAKSQSKDWRKAFSELVHDPEALGDGKALIDGGGILQNQERMQEYWKKLGKGYDDLFTGADAAADEAEAALARQNALSQEVFARSAKGRVPRESDTAVAGKPGAEAATPEYVPINKPRLGPNVERLKAEIQEKVLPKLMREPGQMNAEGIINRYMSDIDMKVQSWGSAHQYQIGLAGGSDIERDIAKLLRGEIRQSFKEAAPSIYMNSADKAVETLGALDKNYWAIGDVAKYVRGRMARPAGAGVDVGAVAGGAGIRSLAWNIPQVIAGRVAIPLMRGVGAGAAAVIARGIGGHGDPIAIAKILSQKAASLKTIQGRTAALQGIMTKTVDGFLGIGQTIKRIDVPLGSEFIKQMMGEKDTRHAVKKFVAETARLHSDPTKVADQIAALTHHFAEDAPTVTMLASTTMASALKRIHDIMPKPPLGASMQPMLDVDQVPSRSAATMAADYITGAARPDIALANFARMTASQEMWRGFSENYPQMASAFMAQLQQQIALMPTRLDPKIPAYIAARGGGSTGPTSRGAYVLSTQSFFQQTATPKKGQATPSLKGLAKSDNLLLSGAQKTETIT